MKELIDKYLKEDKFKKKSTEDNAINMGIVSMCIIPTPIILDITENKTYVIINWLVWIFVLVIYSYKAKQKELAIMNEPLLDTYNKFDIGVEVKHVNGYVFTQVQESFLIEGCKDNKVLLKHRENSLYKEIGIGELLSNYRTV